MADNVISPIVSYQYYQSLGEDPTSSITSPIISYQYFDQPDVGSVQFLNSLPVSYLYQVGYGSPFVIIDPISQTSLNGSNVTFAVLADGQLPLTYQWLFNGQNITGATNATLILNSVVAGNDGNYSVVVGNSYDSITSQNASLAVLTDGANGSQPTQLIPPNQPLTQPAQDGLIIVTHGFIPITDAPTMPTWVTNLVVDISNSLTITTNWSVTSFDWSKYAWGINPEDDLPIGTILGTLYGQQLKQKNWRYVHLIAHSAGAAVIQAIAKQLKSSPNPPFVQMTFLAPFLGALDEWQNVYGNDADWSDCYFTHDWTGGFAQGNLLYAYNVDVDWVDPNHFTLPYGSTQVAYATHDYSHDYYIATVTNTDPTWCAVGFGFALSVENGGQNKEVSYSTGNDYDPQVICGPPGTIPAPNLPLVESELAIANADHALSAFGASLVGNTGFLLNSISSITPLTKSGSSQIHPLDVTVSTNAPAWLAVGVTVSNMVNFIQFDADFIDTNVAEGLLTVYWNTNQVGMVDERVSGTNLETYRFLLPSPAKNGLYALSFRLDSFADASSGILITNVATGFVGISQPIQLSISSAHEATMLQIIGASNFTYQVQCSTNLVDWTPLALLFNTNGTLEFNDTNSASLGSRFYRTIVQ